MTELELQLPIVHHFLKTGRFVTARELARTVKCSESTIRRNLREHPTIAVHAGLNNMSNMTCVPGIQMKLETRKTRSRMHDGTHGEHQIQTYGPTLGLLRQLLRQELGV